MSVTPTGTVTFLFTDIEGSTRLWEQHPDAMRPALARHDQLLRDAIQARGGFVFKTVGDAFCAAFPTAPAALAAALDAQTALAAEGWPDVLALRARMALHAGAAEERGGDYFGPPLNRAARLLAAAHGGQVLLSDVVQELTYDALPGGAALRGLGEHRLRDLGRPEHVFQLLHPSLPVDFPPLKTLDSPDLPNNLSQQPTSFIGREKEVAEVETLLAKTRLLTLTGAGGCGKSRLSLQVAADLLDQSPDGVWLAELAPLSDPLLVPQVVAQALGVREEASQRTLTDALKDKRLLLVLDNCEHVLSACASLAAGLLRHCPGVRILTSSREPLGVAGEQTYRVPSLSLPDPKQARTVESLSQFEAVALFIERAQAVQPSFTVTDANAPAVAQVCFHLDGIPLAIELAAARVRAMPVEQVNARLGDRFRLLTGGSRTALPRQQTLRALLDWSYDLLTEAEKRVLRRLSVFAGGWTLSAAEGVCAGGDTEEWEVLDLLTGLVDKSLVVYEERGDGQGRYRLLETVRQYGRDRLVESQTPEGGEAEEARSRHATFFAGLAEATHGFKAEVEDDNFRAALEWCLARTAGSGDPGPRDEAAAMLGLCLIGFLWFQWMQRNNVREARAYLKHFLSLAVGAGTAMWADALNGAGYLALMQDDNDEAGRYLERSLAAWRELGVQEQVGHLLSNLTWLAENQRDDVLCRTRAEESLAVRRSIGHKWGMVRSLRHLARLDRWAGEYEEAARVISEALGFCGECDDQQGMALMLVERGRLSQALGNYQAAGNDFREALAMPALSDKRFLVAEVVDDLAELSRIIGQIKRATRLFGAAQALRDSVGVAALPREREQAERGIAAARASLGKVEFAAAWDAGRAMTMGQAVDYALAGPDGDVEPSGTPSGPRPAAPS